MAKIQSYINYIADARARRSIRSLFSVFLNDDDPTTFKACTFSGAVTFEAAVEVAGEVTFAGGISIGATASAAIAITGLSGTGYDTAQILVAADAAGTALAYGTSAATYVVERVNATFAITGDGLHYFMGKYNTYTTSAAMSDGMIMGSYQKITIAHDTLESQAVRGRICITGAQAAGTSNQHIGVIGQCELSAVAIDSASTGLYCGIRGMASSESGCTADAPMNGGYFSTDAKSNIVGEVSAIKARMIGYTDYGLKMHVYTSNATAGISIQTDESAVLPAGVLFTSDGTGSITNAFKLPDDGALASDSATSPLTDIKDTASTGFIRVEVGSATKYIALYDAN